MEDHKKIRELLPILKQKNVELISISNHDSYQKWKDYIEKIITTGNIIKKPASLQNIVNQLGISIYPTFILLDNDGKILHSTYYLQEVLSFVK